MGEYYDRYASFRGNGKVALIPNLQIGYSNSDLNIVYDRSRMRLDSLSYKYYGDANYAWLIMLANPKYGSLEFEIPDMCNLRIPYPLTTALARYEKSVSDLR